MLGAIVMLFVVVWELVLVCHGTLVVERVCVVVGVDFVGLWVEVGIECELVVCGGEGEVVE